MISLLDIAGAVLAAVALLLFLFKSQARLSVAERWAVALVCSLTVILNGLSFVAWFDMSASSDIGEGWGDYLQVLHPVLWGVFFYVVVQGHQRRELQASRQRMRDLVENMPVMLTAYDKQGNLLAWNRTAQDVTGYSGAEVRHDPQVLERLFPDALAREQLRQECRQGGGDYRHRVYTVQGKDGDRQIAWYNISRHFPINGWANWSIGLDMTEQLAAQKQLEHLATHDELTGLANRALLQDRLHHALAASQRKNTRGALLMLDLDHYKMINDSHGHPVGDALLREVGKRLSSCLKGTDTLARIGGDEFMILLEEIQDKQQVARVAERILHVLSDTPFDLYGSRIHTRASVGITIFPDDDVRLDELMKNVDLALYSAKQNGRNTCHFYSRQLHGQVRWQHQISEKLRTAIGEGQLQLHYQPQVALADRRVVGAEALLRWPGYDKGGLSPAVFVPIAENMGLMPALGRWVVEHAFQQAAPDLVTGINLSAIQLHQPMLAESLQELLKRWQLNPERIDLEITESAVMRNADVAIATMRRLRDQGFHISLDDFGTGHSSLSYLKRFPVSRIKIDQSFVQNMEHTPSDAAIVRNVIRLGHDLGLQVVAEGVENEAQWQLLENAGCDVVQGFYFSRPLDSGQLQELLQRPAMSVH